MSVKAPTGVLVAIAVATSTVVATPALACKGAEVLLQDDFTGSDPAWNVVFPEAKFGGGKMAVTTEPGRLALVYYEGDFFPGADACVDVKSPNVKDPSFIAAGLSFSSAGGGYYTVYIRPDGYAGVLRWNGGWLNPVGARKFDGIKQGDGQVNTLRVIWKPNTPTVNVFINDQPFVNFRAEPNRDRKLGFHVESEGATFEFTNLKISTPPR